MNSYLPTPSPPHQLYNRLSSMQNPPTGTTGSRKRKAEDDEPRQDDRMSASPSASPNISAQPLHASRSTKRPKSGMVGRALSLPRLLETFDADALRSILKNLCEGSPSIATEIEKSAPRPSVASAIAVLRKYEARMQESFPFGGNQASDYAYNRVRQSLMALLDALNDFTPHFLPPHETQVAQSLSFLDSATDIVHRLPDWDSYQNTLPKLNSYDEITKAWIVVLKEAAKRAGGIQLQYDGWSKKLAKHNHQSQGRLQSAIDELNQILGWTGNQIPASHQPRGDDIVNVRQELLSGTYGSNLGVRVGPW